jgi:hypothetical protein
VSALPQQQATPSPEIIPALDENGPQFEPNLASDPDFCRLVLDHCWRKHLYPEVLQQERLWSMWRRIDDAWRVKGASYDLDISATDPITVVTNPDAKGRGGITDPKDGYSSRVYPATLHQQIVAKTNTHMAIAWGDGLPVKAEIPEDLPVHPLYNPTQQQADAANELLRDCAWEIGLKKKDRIGRGCFAKYGHVIASTDFVYKLKDQPVMYRLPQDPQQQAMLVQMKMQEYGGAFPQVMPSPDGLGQVAVWNQRVVDKMETRCDFIRVDDFFIDQTLSTEDNFRHQLCVALRKRTNRNALFGNDYDPQSNPFGWLNTQQANQDGNPHWQFQGMSNQQFQDELQKKWGLNITGQMPIQNGLKSLWTLYVMLAIYQDPKDGTLKLDDGTGIVCPQCNGSGLVSSGPTPDAPDHYALNHPCPVCEGRMKLWIQPQRYVVEAYGDLEYANSQATCLRIQRNPTPKDRVPVLFSASLTEDTAGAIPLCKAEASLKSVDQEATAVNQYFDAKNGLINPPWLYPEEADGRMDFNRPNRNIPHQGNPNLYQPMRAQLDPTGNLMPFIDMMRGDTTNINNMTPQLLGEINDGRRSATELQNAFDAGRIPVLQEIDQYGQDILAGWAQFHLDYVEAFVDRAWIQEKTGRSGFGKVRLISSVGDEFLKRQSAIGNLQYVAQMVAAMPGANLNPILSAFCQLTKLPINADEVLPDGGVKLAALRGMQIITKILGTGQMVPALPSDPHAIYIEMFEQALQDPYWQQKTPETLPLLQMRLQQQLQLQLQQQQAQLMAQQHAMMLQASAKGAGQKGNGNQPPMSSSPPATSGGANQQMMGGMQG